MARRGHRKRRTDVEKASQKKRTRENKLRKYTKLLQERPNDLHAKKWEEKLANL